MDSLGDIIYLLVLIVVAITGMMGKKNKGKNKPSGTSDEAPATPSDPWEELERQLSPRPKQPGTPQTAAATSAPSPAPYTAKAPGPYSTETIISPSHESPLEQTVSYDTADDISQLRVKKQLRESVTRSRSALRTAPSEQAENISPEAVGIALESAEEAKQAFVYAEIFNRKYT